MASPDRDREVQELFQRALDLPENDRAAFLGEHCSEPELRDEVQSLLQAFADADEFLNEPKSTPGERAGDQIGRYRLLEQIGEGGFGTVWMAEQTEPVRRRVAVKIIKLGMDTKQVVARFEAERQALALMDHPNIAKVLDGGATEHGRPFFVMELVRGLPMTEFCDQANLDTSARLELFQRVCLAVQHAHQKGIIHRDLKPSNVLVTLHDGEPVPKVIDFGVAKATSQELTQRTLFTQFRQMIGTPDYMAPEQAEMSGLDVDTRADVYSLGVILYELLTGTRPFDARELLERGYDEMLRHVREVEPPKPSTRISSLGDRLSVIASTRQIDPSRLQRTVRGELDWIAMRSLEKQRQRRYPTARALAEDVRRFLANEPVEAGPPTAGYRAWKFVNRNRGIVATATIVFASMLVGIVATAYAWQAERDALRGLRQERAEVQRQFERAETVLGFLQDMLGASDPMSKRPPNMSVRDLLRESEQDVRSLQRDPEVEATLRSTIGTAYRNLGDLDRSGPHLEAALSIRRRVLGDDHALVAESHRQLAWQHYARSDYALAHKTMRDALRIGTAKHGDKSSWVAEIRSDLADIDRQLGRLDEAYAGSEAALQLFDELGVDPAETVPAMRMHAMTLTAIGRYAEAETLQRRIVSLLRTQFGKRHLRVANALFDLGETLRQRGRFEDARRQHEQALSQRRELLGDRDVRTASSLNSLAAIAEALGDREEAERRYRESLATDPGHDLKHVLTRANLAMTLMNLKRWDESEREFDTAIAELEQRMPPNHPTLAMILANKARLFELTDRFGEAEQLLQRVIAMRNATLAEDHPQHGVGRAMLGMVQFAQGQDAAADRSIAAAVAILRRAFREPHYFLALTLSNHGHVLRALERNEPAERAFAEAAATYEAAEGRGFEWAEARTGLAAVMIDTDRAAEAVAAAREALTVLTEKAPTNWRRHWCAAVLGEALVRVGEVDEGLALLDDAVRQIQPRRAHHRRLKVRAARVLLPLFRQRGQDDDAAAMQQVIDGAGR